MAKGIAHWACSEGCYANFPRKPLLILSFRTFRAERRRNRELQNDFCLPAPFKKDSSTSSRVINEVVLGTRVDDEPSALGFRPAPRSGDQSVACPASIWGACSTSRGFP